MAENVEITPGAGQAIGADQVTDGTLGTASIQYVKIMDGTIGGTDKATVGPNGLKVDGSLVTQPVSGTVTTVPPTNASTNITEVGGAALTEGQTTMAHSVPVVIASDQTAIPVTGTITTSPNVNVHDGSGNTIASTGTSLNVDVTNTVPVSQSGTWTVGLTTESIEIGKVDQGSPNTAANSWPVEMTDGTNILGTSSHPVRVDPTGTTTQPVSLTSTTVTGTVAVTQSTSPWVVSGTVTTTPPANQSVNLTELNSVALGSPSNYGTSPGAVEVQGVNAFVTNTVPVTGTFFQTTQPVSGTVTANQGTANATPWNENIVQWDGVALGAPSTYGTSPGAVNVPGVNAFVTNIVTAKVTSDVAAAALADNQANTNFFSSSTLVNEPVSTGQWLYGGAFSGTANAALSGWSKQRTPVIFKTVQATASGNTAVWTPGSGNKFRLLRYTILCTENASLAAGAVVTIQFQDATTNIGLAVDTYVPTTAVTTLVGDGFSTGFINLGGFGYLSSAANNVLNINLSATFATGNVRIVVMGTEE